MSSFDTGSELNPSIAVNLRTLSAPCSGVQRYAEAVAARLPSSARQFRPGGSSQGARGHLWEQFALPRQLNGELLFSPANTGPLAYKRQVVTIHDASTFDQAGAFSGLFGRWYRWLLPRLARRSLGVITVSEFSKQRLVATLKISPEKIAVVHNGITPPPATIDTRTRQSIADSLHLPKRFLLFVGSLDPRKNLEKLVQAFSSADIDGVHLLVAGGANRSLFANGQFDPDTQKRVRFLGHVDEATLETLYARAEAFVFPSLYEGFGLPPLEAMARGCPVLCSNTTSMPEVCGDDIDRGGPTLYFPPHSVTPIANALRQFFALPVAQRTRMAERGRAHAARFTWDRCTLGTLQAISHFDRNRFPSRSRVTTEEIVSTTQ